LGLTLLTQDPLEHVNVGDRRHQEGVFVSDLGRSGPGSFSWLSGSYNVWNLGFHQLLVHSSVSTSGLVHSSLSTSGLSVP